MDDGDCERKAIKWTTEGWAPKGSEKEAKERVTQLLGKKL